ncbi:glycoside hydrolase family 75 protein [Streptomyces sp. NPDC014894]|uniref:glycoside hydrolase family 75 protein n=1 Tax=Streptomyces sp. NPDC014894 TaxID=3364931 RepID=UPI0036F6D5B5
MPSRTLALSAALSAALLPALAPPAAASGVHRVMVPGSYGVRDVPADAARLLAKVRGCAAQVSRGAYREDANGPASVRVCEKDGAVYWKADLDVDCDGLSTRRCNAATDPYFVGQTAFTQSDGRPLSAERLPFVVVPAPSAIWRHSASGVRGGGVVAVVHEDKVRYGVVGDTGPARIIGEASYAMAESLGIDPDPRTGGAGSGVTYIFFKDSRATPIEDRAEAARLGESLARRFLRAD